MQETAAAPGAPAVANMSPQNPRDVAARLKLAELKRESTLCEIGHEPCSAGPAAGEIDLVMSELCTVFVDASPPTDVSGSEMFAPMLPGEDVQMAIPPPRNARRQAGGVLRDWDGFDPGPATCNTKTQGTKDGQAAAVRASRGVLLEFVWPPAQRSSGQGLGVGKSGHTAEFARAERDSRQRFQWYIYIGGSKRYVRGLRKRARRKLRTGIFEMPIEISALEIMD